MVRTALVLAETALGKAKDIANLMKYLNGIKAVHMVSESYGAIALVEAGDSDGIREIASRIALTSGVARCVVCSEHELTDEGEANVFAGILDDDYSCWCVGSPLAKICARYPRVPAGSRQRQEINNKGRGGGWKCQREPSC